MPKRGWHAPDGARVQIAYPPARIEGRTALAEHVGAIMAAWPDFVLETRSEGVTSDGRLLFEWTFSGTQQADCGPIPGSGQSLSLDGVSVASLADGLIDEERVYWDTATLLDSAGMLPG
jgi:hypothetical protein